MLRISLLLSALILAAIAFSCTKPEAPPATTNDKPTEAYKRLFAAVKAKNIEAIKKEITKKSVEFATSAAQKYGKSVEAMLENGQTATTFAESLPAMRDERVKDNFAALEVWNSQESVWEDLPFIIEDGQWKLAMGEQMAGSYKSPGKGRDQIEREAANALGKGPTANVKMPTNANSVPDLRNANSGPAKR